MATEKPRFSITLDEALLDKVEDYRHENRISTRSKAVVQLVEQGINELLKDTSETKKAPLGRSWELMDYFDRLNSVGQDKLIDYARLLTGSAEHLKSRTDKLA